MKKLNVYVAGHRGLVGSAIVRELEKDKNVSIIKRTRKELDLTNQNAVANFFANTPIDQVYLAAAKVGGIYANSTFPADYIFQNLMIQTNVINSAFVAGVEKLLFLGSSCIYPRDSAQPITEDSLLGGILEKSNEAYAIAKIAGIKLCESYNRQYRSNNKNGLKIDYRSVMPTNLYGPGDNYHPNNSHVIPALIQRFHEAKIRGSENVVVWGSGSPKREFLFVDDMAKASVIVMNLSKSAYDASTDPMCSHINVGSGVDLTIKEVAETIKHVVDYQGKIVFDLQKPDGTPRKILNSRRMRSFGWTPEIEFKHGLEQTYVDFLKQNI